MHSMNMKYCGGVYIVTVKFGQEYLCYYRNKIVNVSSTQIATSFINMDEMGICAYVNTWLTYLIKECIAG